MITALLRINISTIKNIKTQNRVSGMRSREYLQMKIKGGFLPEHFRAGRFRRYKLCTWVGSYILCMYLVPRYNHTSCVPG
jgi:hypothetical protein